jgi:hypothetical protein
MAICWWDYFPNIDSVTVPKLALVPRKFVACLFMNTSSPRKQVNRFV